jgi:hypothetical protein
MQGLYEGMEPQRFRPSSAPIKSPGSHNRAAWWRQDLERNTTYLMGQARTDDERAFVEKLYEDALEEGPDFTFTAARAPSRPLGIDRNTYARILSALDMIERGTLPTLP